MRPIIISVISIFMLLLGAAGMYFTWQTVHGTNPVILHRSAISWALVSIDVIGTGIGLWFMKRWAFAFYAFFWLLNLAGAIITGSQFEWRSLVGPALMAILFACYYQRFGANQSSKRTREKPRAA